LLGITGILVSRPEISFPAYTGFRAEDSNLLWPVLFVTVACGAISGFHSLISSGTSSKQLENEKDARKIGYGGMMAEGILSVIVLIVIAAVFKDRAGLSAIISAEGKGPIAAFGQAFGAVTDPIMGRFGAIFAILMLNGFILTTLDTATRITRYVSSELFKVKSKYLSTLIVVAVSGWLGLSGEWNQIWPIFGAANQLVAALALIVITSWLLSKGKWIRYTLFPTIFMLATAIGALVVKALEYLSGGVWVLFFISAVLIVLAVYIFIEALKARRLISLKAIG
jgi:carbon starvation protein